MATKTANKKTANTTNAGEPLLETATADKLLVGVDDDLDTEALLSTLKEIRFSAEEEEEEETSEVEEEDNWNKEEEEDSWDPDFDEFDIPKSGAKTGGKKGKDEDDDFAVDDEFKDLFGGGAGLDDEEDDF